MSVGGAILLVDDNESVRDFGAMALRSRGFDVVVAANGEECLRVIADRPSAFGAIVLDMWMPDINGDQVVQRLRADGTAIPVLLCSGLDISDAELDAIGADGFLPKPYRMGEIVAACQAVMS